MHVRFAFLHILEKYDVDDIPLLIGKYLEIFKKNSISAFSSLIWLSDRLRARASVTRLTDPMNQTMLRNNG